MSLVHRLEYKLIDGRLNEWTLMIIGNEVGCRVGQRREKEGVKHVKTSLWEVKLRSIVRKQDIWSLILVFKYLICTSEATSPELLIKTNLVCFFLLLYFICFTILCPLCFDWYSMSSLLYSSLSQVSSYSWRRVSRLSENLAWLLAPVPSALPCIFMLP